MGQAIDALSDPLEPPILQSVAQALPREAGPGRPTSGEVSFLLLRRMIESVAIRSSLGYGLYCKQNFWEYLSFRTYYSRIKYTRSAPNVTQSAIDFNRDSLVAGGLGSAIPDQSVNVASHTKMPRQLKPYDSTEASLRFLYNHAG
jgi:hypothetical protein